MASADFSMMTRVVNIDKVLYASEKLIKLLVCLNELLSVTSEYLYTLTRRRVEGLYVHLHTRMRWLLFMLLTHH